MTICPQPDSTSPLQALIVVSSVGLAIFYMIRRWHTYPSWVRTYGTVLLGLIALAALQAIPMGLYGFFYDYACRGLR